jgi:hypothetical protein
MKTFTPAQIQEILAKHQLWREGKESGERADFTGALLVRANLAGANLTGVILADANLAGADLTRAYLMDADLTDAYFWGADLTGAFLTGANLAGANLTGAYIMDAYLMDADLTGAYLTGAILAGTYLAGADLTGALLGKTIGNGEEIKSMQLGTYSIIYTAEVLQIGCKQHPIADWWDFTDEQIHGMDGQKALDWWNKYKPPLRQIIELSPATPTGKEAT